MNINKLEEALPPNLHFKNVQEIPQFPESSFSELKARINNGEYDLDVDLKQASKLPEPFPGELFYGSFRLVTAVNWLYPVFFIYKAIANSNSLYLLGIPLGIIAQFTSNGNFYPFLRNQTGARVIAQGFSFLVLLLNIGFFVFFKTIGHVWGILIICFLIFFWRNKISANQIRIFSLKSEVAFLYLYENRVLKVFVPESNSIHSFEKLQKSKIEKNEDS